jgi:dipeptidyl aminopeptidase/acylaminoacyl peptidase
VTAALPQALSALLLLGLLFAARIAWRSYLDERSDFIRWPPTALSRRPELAGVPDLMEISYTGPEALRLAGWYVPSRNRGAVVLAHGTNAERSSLLTEIAILAEAGFGVLAPDFPGQGASEGKTLWGAVERGAISAAVDWLCARAEVDASRIGGFGFSMGGYILIQAAVLDSRLRAVALAAPPSDVLQQTRIANSRWGALSEHPALWALRASGMPYDELVPKDIIGRIAPRPVLLIGGDLDHVVPESMVRSLHEMAGTPKGLWIVSGAEHGGYVKAAPREYASHLVDFFRTGLLN